MEHCVDTEDLKMLLLKCVGSKYPIRIKCKSRDDVNFAFVHGFADAECSKLLVSKNKSSQPYQLDVVDIVSIESFHEITLERMRSRVFYVN